MQTYWLRVSSGSDTTSIQRGLDNSTGSSSGEGKITRLVNWNVEVLASLLKKIVARREAMGKSRSEAARGSENTLVAKDGTTVLEEVLEIIPLPEFNGDAIRRQVDPDSIALDKTVMEELALFVEEVALSYRKNPFHNFEHASHGTAQIWLTSCLYNN